MQCFRHNITPDGRVYMDCYIQDWTPARPFLPTRPAVIICPGGAYILVSDREGEPVALSFAARGFNAFVLHYSIGYYARFPAPVIDAALAVKAVRDNAEKWHIDKNKVAVAGFSAGGHLSACIGTMAAREDILEGCGATEEEIRPNAIVMGYPISTVDEEAMIGLFAFVAGERTITEIEQIASPSLYVDEKTPPAFVFAFYNDMLTPVEQSMKFCSAMAEHDRPFELHVFAKGEHGCAGGDDACALGEENMKDESVKKWQDMCVKWLEDMFGKPDLGRKFESILVSSADNRAHWGEQVLPVNLFEKVVVTKTPGRRFSLSTRVADAAANPAALEVLLKFFPEVAASPRLTEFYEMPIQTLVLAAGGSMDQETVLELAKALRKVD